MAKKKAESGVCGVNRVEENSVVVVNLQFTLPCSIMVVREILALYVRVRILARQLRITWLCIDIPAVKDVIGIDSRLFINLHNSLLYLIISFI